jgi:hypothetical protein
MLTEFLLTPDAFVQTGDAASSDPLRELQDCLFPFNAVSPVLLCQLGGDEWRRAIGQRVAKIANVNQRTKAQSLLVKILDQIAVIRPGPERAGDCETDWIAAGQLSAKKVPLERIVVCNGATLPKNTGVTLKEFTRSDFWQPYGNPRLVGRNLDAQAATLRALCTHADWLVVRLPQIRGSGDDEIVSAKQIIELATDLPAGFTKSAVELHICQRKGIPDDRLIRQVVGELRHVGKSEVCLDVLLWPEGQILNRELLAGTYAKTSVGELHRRALWWLTMTHVAVGGKSPHGDDANAWSLFSRVQANTRLVALTAQKPLQRISVYR